MKKIYLLLLLALLSFNSFATTWYSVFSGRLTNLNNWRNSPTGTGLPPTAFNLSLGTDIWVVQVPMTIGAGETWSVAGNVYVTYPGVSIIDSSTVGPVTINVGGSFVTDSVTGLTDAITSTPNASNLTINLKGDVRILGQAAFTPKGSTTFQMNFVNVGGATLSAPQNITWTSTGHSYKTNLAFNGLSRLGSNLILPDTATGAVLNDTLMCNTYSIIGNGAMAFNINDASYIYTRNTGGMDSTIKYCANSFSRLANYVFNGIAPQITGLSLPDTIGNHGSVWINNLMGVTASKALTFTAVVSPGSRSFLYLEKGTFRNGISDSIVAVVFGVVYVDSGFFSNPPTYANADVEYVNLGYNALAITTGYELQPIILSGIIPTAAQTNLSVNKPGAIISLGATPTILLNSVGLTAGTLDASPGNYNLNISISWVNLAGPNAFVARSGTVSFLNRFNSSDIELYGMYPTTFNNVVLNNKFGTRFSLFDGTHAVDEYINGNLMIDSGNLYIYGQNLIMGPSATISGSLSDSAKIVADSTGRIEKQMAGNGTFLFPVGDSSVYTPITLAFSGSGAYSAGAFSAVNLRPKKEPHNLDTTNYLNRYWTVSIDSIAAPSYTATYTYKTTDVVGTEGNIAGGAYNLVTTMPYQIFGYTNAATHTITTGVVNDTAANFTGIDGVPPTVTLSDDTTICVGGFDTLSVIHATGDTPFTYTWAPAAGLSATTGAVVAATPTVTTTYTVTLTNGNGITATDTVRITVNAVPTLDSARTNSPICSGNTLLFTPYNPQNVTGYLWQGPVAVTDSTLATASIPGAYTTATGIYTVTVNNGIGSNCKMTYTASATVDTFPNATVVTGGGVYCDTTTIYAHLNGPDVIYYQGTTANGTSTTDADSVIHLSDTGTHTYYFRALSSLGCWGQQGSVTVTIHPLPLPDTAAGGGVFCDSTVITASSGDSGTVYFQGTTSGGTSTTLGGSPHTVTASGTYYFRSVSAYGCWGAQDSVTVTINPSPTPVVVSPLSDGTFCGSDTINVSGGTGGTIYFEGTTSGGTDMTTAYAAPQVVNTSGTYYFRARSTAGCWSKQDSAAVNINVLPATVTITTAGSPGNAYCDSTTIFADNGGDQVIYFEDTVANGTSTAVPATSAFINRLGDYVYHFRAHNALTGCWSQDASVEIVINALPAPVTATGSGGPFCGSTQVYGDNGGDPVYFEGMTRGGTSTDYLATAASPYTIYTTGTNTFYLRAENAAGCWSTEGISEDSVTVTINPLPTIHNVTGGGSYCSGGAGFHIGLDGSDTGISYQLYNQTDTVGAILAGTGSALDFGIDTAGGTFTVIAINNTTLCADTTSSTTNFAQVIVNPLPYAYTVMGGGAYCANGTGVDISLDNTQTFITYNVYDNGVLKNTVVGGSTFDLGIYMDTGTYYVIGVTSFGCTTTMLDSVHISTIPLPTFYTVTGGGTLCAGDTGYHVFLSGSDTGAIYQLINGTTSVGIPLIGGGGPLDFGLHADNGNYIVTAANQSTGCVDTMTGTVTIIVNQLPLQKDLQVANGGVYCSGTGGLVITLQNSESGIDYQLYHAGTVDGSPIVGTGSDFDFPTQTLAGYYSVLARNPFSGCKSLMADSVSISINGLPTVYTVFGGGNYCSGGAGYSIGIGGSQSGFSYVLSRGGAPVDTVLGTGGIISFGTYTAAGTYTVVSQNPTTSCTSNMAGSATIIINSLPIVDTVRGGGHYCANLAGEHVILSNSSAGINYQLSDNGVNVGGMVPGIGGLLDFGIFLPAGTYKVVATNPVTGCISPMADSAIISIDPLPTVYSITGGGSYCANGTGVAIGLSGSSTGINYYLYHGTVPVDTAAGDGSPISPFGLYTAAGTYTVKAANPLTGCTDSMTGHSTVSINPLPPSRLLIGGGTYCLGGAGVDVSLTVSDPGYLYLLYDGTSTVGPPRAGTGASIDFGLQTLGGTYTVIGIDTATTCSDTMTGSAVITVESPLIPVLSIAAHPGLDIAVGQNDTLVANVTGGGTGVTYQWYVNGNLVTGATNDTFAFTVYYNTDSITCQATSHGTCGGYTTAQSTFISLHNVGVQQINAAGSDIKLVPNPNKGIFTLKGTLGTTNDQEVTVEISDMLGQTIYKQNVMTTGGNVNEKIQLNSSLANGMYILNLRSGTQNNIFHFVIEQ